MKRSYSEKLRDPRWQKRRLEILEKAQWRCKKCGRKDIELQVHHAYYEKSKDPWDYQDHMLLCVCSQCHEDIERIKRVFAMNVMRAPLPISEEIVDLMFEMIALYEADRRYKFEQLISAAAFNRVAFRVALLAAKNADPNATDDEGAAAMNAVCLNVMFDGGEL